ncbi:MAG: DNA polymerase IV, partial [Metallibacterium sp.]
MNSIHAPIGSRKIIHVDMDAFYASVEQRDDPALRGRPVVVAWRGPRAVVCAASYEARVFGVRSAMPALRAERLCPGAVFVAPDFTRYRAVSQQVRAIFARYTDRVEPLSLDEAYLDVSAPRNALPSATAMATDIRAAIRAETALTASAGVACNKFLAKIASDWRKPDGLFVIRPAAVEGFLAPLPVARLPGVGTVMEQKLARLGVRRVADLRALGAQRLVQQFGRWGLRLHELALGIDDSPVRRERPSLQISAEDTFAQDLHLDQLDAPIAQLAAKVWAAYVREQDRIARTVVLKLKTAYFRTLTRSHTDALPAQSEAALVRAALQLRARVELPASTRYRLVGVGLSGFVDADTAQPDLFFAAV